MKRWGAAIKGAHTAEWLAWPVWLCMGFVATIVLGGVAAGVADLLGFGRFIDSTLGSMVLSAFIYVALVVILMSITRIPYVVRLPKGVSNLVVIAVAVAASILLHAVHLANFWSLVLVALVAGMVVVLSSIPVARRKVGAKVLGVARPLSWSDLGLGIAGYVIYMAVFIAITVMLVQWVPAYNSTQPQDLGFNALFGLDRLIGFIVLVIITPIAEELVMRGFLFGKLRQAKMPFWPTAVIVSLIFGFAHGQWNVGVDTLILSMVACYLREMTGTIWPGVVIHMLKNAVAFVMLFVFVI